MSETSAVSPYRVHQSAPLVVLGMHRSGTSFLTGSLQLAGLELGRHSASNPHNLKGNRESQELVAVHDALLARHGFAWDLPPSGPLPWTESDVAAVHQWMTQYEGKPRWGFKDPRSLLLVEGWRNLLPDAQFVGIFRHPTAVALSLDARGGMPLAKAYDLWKAYNIRLLALHRQQPFPLLCFDDDEQVLHQKLDRVLFDLGLKSPLEEYFFSPELKHHQKEDVPLPEDLDALYQELRRRSL